MPVDVVVVGSINHDLTVVADRLPRPGETVLGISHYAGGGGKGANQAVAAARLGSSVAMLGRVGRDQHGLALVSHLRAEGVDVSGVGIDPHAPTGMAVITVDGRGENSIVVIPGANMSLDVEDISGFETLITEARVVLAQLEVPVETVAAAAGKAAGIFCLNPAPARPLPPELLALVDVLIPNRSELSTLAGGPEPEELDAVVESAASIPGPGAVVVTLGADGALVVEDDRVERIRAPGVDVVDTTGAGDAFCAGLATALSRGDTLTDAARLATAAGALATTRPGAQAAMPHAGEVEALMAR